MNLIDLFSGKTGLVERSSLIKHSTNKANQEDIQRMQNAERSSTNSDNQAFLTDVRFRLKINDYDYENILLKMCIKL